MNSLIQILYRKLSSASLGALLLLATTSAFAQAAAPQYIFTHLAGPLGGSGNVDGTGSAARFHEPYGVAVDNAGYVYVADSGNNTIRKISPTGVVTTLAGMTQAPGSADGTGSAASFNYPYKLAVDNAGNVYVADYGNKTIRKISPSGTVTTLAGAARVSGNTDGTGSDARFTNPSGVAVDGAGNVYVADTDLRTGQVRKITPGGVVTTLATVDGMRGGLTIDSTGKLFLSANNHILTVTPTGTVTTLHPGDYRFVAGLAVDSAGNVYLANNGNSLASWLPSDNMIRKVAPDGSVSLLAGSDGSVSASPGSVSERGSADGTGAVARFYQPSDICADSTGNVYVADTLNHTIRKISPSGVVTTLAGLAGGSGNADGTGVAARFYDPSSVGVDRTGNVYVADTSNGMIRKITPGGVVSTFAGPSGNSTADGTGAAAGFSHPAGVALDDAGNVYIADRWNNTLRKITPGAVVTTLAGDSGGLGNWDVLTQYNFPYGVAVDGTGTIYWAKWRDSSISKVTPGGTETTLAGANRYDVAGSADGTGTTARFDHPRGVAVDGTGNIYVADTWNGTIRKITSDGTVTTLAGTPKVFGSADGNGAEAKFNSLSNVAVDSVGNIFVVDSGSHTIRRITASGQVTTVAGKTGEIGSADGSGTEARFNDPTGIAVDSAGNLYIADSGNHAIRKGQLMGPPVITTQPLSQTVAPGNNVQFSVTASAVPAPTYQWFFNSSAFSGATTNTLTFANARSADAGDYTVVVTNQLGSVTSAKATLTISSTPVPAPSPAPTTSGGGGSIEGWFVLAFIILGATRGLAARAIGR